MLLYLKYKVIKGYISVVDPDLQIRGRGRGGGGRRAVIETLR